jgi:phospholipase C
MSHIDHIVLVVMENHAYDNYFGVYCQVLGKYCPAVGNGIPKGTCVPIDPANSSAGCIKPFAYTDKNWSVSGPMPHTWGPSHEAWNNGSMNGFYLAEDSGLNPFGYYDGATAPIYWDLAEQYGLGDDFFSSVLSYSLPNHWYLVAGQAPGESLQHTFGPRVPAPSKGNDSLYLYQANHVESVEDELENSSVTWRYYDTTLGNYTSAVQDTTHHIGRAYAYWNPQAAKGESYNATFSPHFVNNTQFFSDAHNGTLPNLSWVIPHEVDNDHPPQNSSLAQGWLASVVDAVEASPDWNTTALFVTWDEYGGFYDHVAPPYANGTSTVGFRVPLLVISPYAKEDYIGSQFSYFESILHLMEWRFGLGCLQPTDCSAPLPLGFFDFGAAPRAPMMFPTTTALASYPMPLQKHNSRAKGVAAFTPPSEYVDFPGNSSQYTYAD